MTAEKMTLAEALDVVTNHVHAEVNRHAQMLDWKRLKQANAVLREFRERGLPLYEVTLAECQKPCPEWLGNIAIAYRRLTTEGE